MDLKEQRISQLTNMGKGRPKGSKNKSIEQREALYLAKLDESDIQFKLLNKLIERVDNDEIRTAEIIKAISTINAYLIRTIDQIKQEEIVEKITTREQAQEKLEEFKNVFSMIKAVK
ncbi:hypothetical protein QUR06_000255 [Escherichia coli]|nr:hypothetical protein [Escherichia coli]